MAMNNSRFTRSSHIVVTLALLLGAGTLGYGVHRWYLSNQPGHPLLPLTIEPAELTSNSTTIPAHLPDFVIRDSNNTPRSAQEWRGKSLILNFWATWCPPCIREIPLLKALHLERSQRGFEVLGIAMDFRDDVLAYAEQAAIPYPVLIGEAEAIELANKLGIGATGLPFTVFTDRAGRIVTIRIGELREPEANAILNAVQGINEGSISLEEAKAKIAALRQSRG